MDTIMKALVIEDIDAPFKIKNYSVPEPDALQVRVKVIASGVNPLDIKIRAGKAPHARHQLPAVLGMDMAGIIDAVGRDVRDLKIGDRVFGLTGGVGGHQGSLAEYQLVDSALVAKVPDNLTLREAASIPLVFITAWEGLVDRANVQPGHKVLVHGGAGGVGQMVVQIAIAKGATVYATCSITDAELIRKLGAVPIDYEVTSEQEYMHTHTNGEGFDIVYDTVGGSVLDSSFNVVKTYTGHVVSCLGWGTHSIAPLSFRGATYSGVFTLLPLLTGKAHDAHGRIMREASSLIALGKLSVIQDQRFFDFPHVSDAHEYVMSGAAQGKVVINISDDQG